jgi:hypothetical protein
MHVDLNQWRITNAVEAVDLSGLDDENVTGTRLELFAVHRPETAPRFHELDFVVRMTMRTRTAARERSKEKHGDIHVTVVGPNELMRAAPEGQIVPANAIHPVDAPLAEAPRFYRR